MKVAEFEYEQKKENLNYLFLVKALIRTRQNALICLCTKNTVFEWNILIVHICQLR